ncbi:MAG: hypothetical protein AAB131_17070, partial [Actinomycetota bacterium]
YDTPFAAALYSNDGTGTVWCDVATLLAVPAWGAFGDFDADGDPDWEIGDPAALLNTRIRPAVPDTNPPDLSIDEPVDDTLATVAPQLRLRFVDADTGIDPLTFRVAVNGADVNSLLWANHLPRTPDSAIVWPPSVPWIEGANVVTIEARDIAGNGVRRQATFTLDSSGQSPTGARLEARSAGGVATSAFRSGETIQWVVTFANGGGATLHNRASDRVCVFDEAGRPVGAETGIAAQSGIDGLGESASSLPCAVNEFTGTWSQQVGRSSTLVAPGRYVVQACVHSGTLAPVVFPPQIAITIQ